MPVWARGRALVAAVEVAPGVAWAPGDGCAPGCGFAAGGGVTMRLPPLLPPLEGVHATSTASDATAKERESLWTACTEVRAGRPWARMITPPTVSSATIFAVKLRAVTVG